MTQDKELLLKDLCARLSHNVKIHAKYTNLGETIEVDGIVKMIDDDGTVGIEVIYDTSSAWTYIQIDNVKPYLFPLSSLTEEQRNDISKLLIDTQNTFSPYGKINIKGCDNLFVCSVKQANAFINYCLMHHLDINGLIEKGLAIDATGLNIY